MNVELVYALPDVQYSLLLNLPESATVTDALNAAAQDVVFARFDFADAPVGVWGEVVGRSHVLGEGDRLEVYRPLQADPKAARRARATRSSPDRAPGPE